MSRDRARRYRCRFAVQWLAAGSNGRRRGRRSRQMDLYEGALTRSRHPWNREGTEYALLNADLYTRRTIGRPGRVVKPILPVERRREGACRTFFGAERLLRRGLNDTTPPAQCADGVASAATRRDAAVASVAADIRLTIGYAPMRRSLARAGWRTVNSWDKGSPPSLRWNIGRGHRFKPSSIGHRPTVHEDNHRRRGCTTPSAPVRHTIRFDLPGVRCRPIVGA